MVANAASTYCYQGDICKEGEPIENILFDFTQKAEFLWRNMFYVACSQLVVDEICLAFVHPMSTSDLQLFGASQSASQQKIKFSESKKKHIRDNYTWPKKVLEQKNIFGYD